VSESYYTPRTHIWWYQIEACADYNIIAFTFFIVTAMYVDLNYNFLLIVLIYSCYKKISLNQYLVHFSFDDNKANEQFIY
jgi:hypothetical protein